VAGPLKDLHLIPYSPSRAPVADMNIVFYYTLPDQTALHKGFYPGGICVASVICKKIDDFKGANSLI